MGFVFKARQPHLDRLVALKLLPEHWSSDAQFSERFNREGRVLARLNHPNIVSVYDFGRADGLYYLLLEFVDGVNLRQAMHAGRFSPAEALAIVPRICEALQYAHEQGILHRDIKPENILLDAKGRVKIADFGIAKLIAPGQTEPTLTGTGAALGTPHYMAPEQLERPSEVDHRPDIYSVGVVFYEMLTGELPIGRFAPPSAKTPVDGRVDEVVLRTLEKEREKRFQSAGEVKTRVEDLQTSARASASAPPILGAGPEIGAAPQGGEVQASKRRLSTKALVSAILTALSLAILFLILSAHVALSVSGVAARISVAALLLLVVPALILGMAGTALGWIALNDIRRSLGRLSGRALAMFAALAWPVLLLIAIFAIAPFLLLVPVTVSMAAPPMWLVIPRLMLPIGILALIVWFIARTAQWTTGKVIRLASAGVFCALLLGALVFALVVVSALFGHRRVVRVTEPAVEVAPVTNAEPVPLSDPIRLRFRVAKGQVATFEVWRKDQEPAAPVPFFAGYFASSDAERGRGELVLSPIPLSWNEDVSQQDWTMDFANDDGAMNVRGTRQKLGPLISVIGTEPNNFLDLSPNGSAEIVLTQPYPPGVDTNGVPPGATLSLVVRSAARREHVAAPQRQAFMCIGTTNWVKHLAAQTADTEASETATQATP